VRLAVTPWGGLALVEQDDGQAGGVGAAGAFSLLAGVDGRPRAGGHRSSNHHHKIINLLICYL
jgi:hypothetical protein